MINNTMFDIIYIMGVIIAALVGASVALKAPVKYPTRRDALSTGSQGGNQE